MNDRSVAPYCRERASDMGDGPVTASGSLPRRRTHPGSVPVDEQADDPLCQNSDRELPY